MTAAWAYGEPSDIIYGRSEECLLLYEGKNHGLADCMCGAENAFFCEVRGNFSPSYQMGESTFILGVLGVTFIGYLIFR